MTQLKLEKRDSKWSPFKAIGQADKFIEDLMVPSIGKELAADQNLDFPNLMNDDNKKVLLACCKTGKKIFIEKPVFLEKKQFKKFIKYKKQIFVGYNRIFYKNVEFLKKKIKNSKN